MPDYVFEVTVEITTSPDATIVKLKQNNDVMSVGTAKRHPSDENDEGTGINLATRRAFMNYADYLIDRI